MLEINMETELLYLEENPNERDYQLNLRLKPQKKYQIKSIPKETTIEEFYLSDEKERKQLLEK